MSSTSIAQQNWAGGELSPHMGGRWDLPVYQTGAKKFVNFIPEAAGPARYRSGSRFVSNTRRNQVACFIPFQFNSTSAQAYEIECTEKFFRFYQNEAILTFDAQAITDVTQDSPGVVTVASHGLSDGDEVIVESVLGMTELNNRNFVVANATTNTFTLMDTFGVVDIDTSAYGAYISGGTIRKIFELATPYKLVDLFELKYGPNADTIYIVHPNYEPRKLIRSGALSWALSLFIRSGDPFTNKKTITGITQANPAQVTATAHGFVTGDTVILETIVGMTELNGGYYVVTRIDADNFTLDGIDSSAYTAYGSGGYASNQNLLPGAFAFFQSRAVYGYSGLYPVSFWGSKPLDASGNPQYDDLTVGTAVTDAYKFTMSSITGKVDRILSIVPTLNFMAICTYEGISRADGATAGESISPESINITPAITFGVLRNVTPLLLGINLMFIHRSGLVLYSMEFDVFYSAYNALDKNLHNDHIYESGVTQMVYNNGRPSLFFAVRSDGVLVGTSILIKEEKNGACRCIFGGTNSFVWTVGNMPRTNAYDQTWVVVEREVNGQIVRHVEFITDPVVIPEKEEFFTSEENQEEDEARWRRAVFEVQKQYVFVDSALSYFGDDYATVTLTPGAVTGDEITFTASGDVFTEDMVGRGIWKKAIRGIGKGRATITEYVSPTEVVCDITVDFDVIDDLPVGGWYLTTDTVSGAWHLEGESVTVQTDGGHHEDILITNGRGTIQYQASVIHLGLGYRGLIKSMDLVGGGADGQPSTGKTKLLNRLDLSFLNTLGAFYGSSLYRLEEVEFRQSDDFLGMPPPPFTGVKTLHFPDISEPQKHIYIIQDKPLPCTVLTAVPFFEISAD